MMHIDKHQRGPVTAAPALARAVLAHIAECGDLPLDARDHVLQRVGIDGGITHEVGLMMDALEAIARMQDRKPCPHCNGADTYDAAFYGTEGCYSCRNTEGE